MHDAGPKHIHTNIDDYIPAPKRPIMPIRGISPRKQIEQLAKSITPKQPERKITLCCPGCIGCKHASSLNKILKLDGNNDSDDKLFCQLDSEVDKMEFDMVLFGYSVSKKIMAEDPCCKKEK